MDFLLASGLAISTFVSDRHTSIAKHMREKLPNITHYFDLWHLKKSKFLFPFYYAACLIYSLNIFYVYILLN
jgi:hypothetical protein